jgi:CTP-dependent riboflavin kinase
MVEVRGRIHEGNKDFTKRMNAFVEVFREAVGEDLFPGTLNVRVDKEIRIKEHFRISGADIGEPDQDLLFEICRVNGRWAYRIRPYNLADGSGGHGDHILEIACSVHLRREPDFDETDIHIDLFRADK